MLEDFRLKVFVTVAQEKSFTKAAEKLGVSQPAVSQNIAELERFTGRKLFERLRGETLLTPEGAVFINYAEKLLDLTGVVDNLWDDLPESKVRICVSDEIFSCYLASAFEDFKAVHPNITLERCDEGDCDLYMFMRPSSAHTFDLCPDLIGRVRVSLSPVQRKMGDVAATHEKIYCFDLIFQPSQAFACTKTCRLMKNYFASFL